MPLTHYLIVIMAVLVAAGATVWLLLGSGPGALVAALPAVMIAAVAVRYFGR